MAERKVDLSSALKAVGSGMGLLALDEGQCIVHWNSLLESWTGLSAEDVIGQDVSERFEPFREQIMQKALKRTLQFGLPGCFSPFVHKPFLPCGSVESGERLCRLTLFRLEDERGPLVLIRLEDVSGLYRVYKQMNDRYQRTVQDLNQRLNLERQIAEERVDLEKSIEERTRELRASLRELELTNMRLEQANQHKNRFLSSMSHELRTPLNAILGFNDLLQGQFFGELNEKQLTYVKQIDSSSKHLLALISDLLDIAKIDAGTMDLTLENVPVEEFIYATQTMLNPQFKERDLEVNTYVDPVIGTIQADRRKWKQIMLNLLSNAIKYTPSKGRIDIHVLPEGDEFIRVEVRDTGVGIKKDDIEKVFSDFYQTERIRDQQLGGTGIGLALTKRMVELHKGRIFAESEPGRGSCFWFTLPVSHDAECLPIAITQDAELRDGGVAKCRILVVEDDPTNQEMVLDMLSIQGHEVRGACNGREALQMAEEYRPDLILMDIRMPVMDGFQATRAFRKMERYKDTPIIALTANTSSHSEADCLEAGCSAYVSKPIRCAKLFELLDEYLPAHKRNGS
ncbi:MAG: ATP-binding protein [Kiritimatiellae bacterium]|nr:ATP-binding protein [Kiritimatiellia bacterium]